MAHKTDVHKQWERLSPEDRDELWGEMVDDLSATINAEINADILAILKGEKPAPPPPPLENPGMFWIEQYAENQFGVRGMGQIYADFYQRWTEIAPHVESEREDWPWHYFTLKQGSNHILEPWQEYIHDDIWKRETEKKVPSA